MKYAHAIAVLGSLLLAIPASYSAPLELPDKKNNTPDGTLENWLGWPHYHGYGLVVPLNGGSPSNSPVIDNPPILIDVQATPDHDANSVVKSFIGSPATLLSPAGFASATDIHTSINPVVRLAAGKNALLVKLRREFQFVNEEVPGAEVFWERDHGIESWNFRGSLMADVYLDSLYNSKVNPLLPGLNKNKEYPLNMFFRFGMDLDYSSADGPTARDVRKYYATMSFWMNSSNHFILDGLQFVQLGALYEQDVVNDVDQWKLILNWQVRSGGSPKDGKTVTNKDHVPFGLGRKNYLDEGHQHYFVLTPKFDFENALTKVKNREFDTLGDTQVGASAEAVLSLWNESLQFRYLVREYWNLGNFGQNHTYQEARVDFWPWGAQEAIHSPSNRLGKINFWESLARAPQFYASYRFGEDAPTYKKQDAFIAGVTVRF